MAKTKGFRQVKQKEFEIIKALHKAGVPENMIQKLSKRSWLIVRGIRETDSLDEYHRYVSHYTMAHSKKTKKQTEVSEVATVTQPVEGDYPHIVRLLESIVNQQTSLSQDLNTVMEKLRLK